jgi:hypothetical protein
MTRRFLFPAAEFYFQHQKPFPFEVSDESRRLVWIAAPLSARAFLAPNQ